MKLHFIRIVLVTAILSLLVGTLTAQGKRLWVLRESGEMVEYDMTTFAAKPGAAINPLAAGKSLGPFAGLPTLSVNRLGQMLLAVPVGLPLAESDVASPQKVWFWDGHAATTFDQGLSRKVETEASNTALNEGAPMPYLAADGAHLLWFASREHRLQREDVDLSTAITWQAWRTDLAGAAREDLVEAKLPECKCKTGDCEDSCAAYQLWVPSSGVGNFFLLSTVAVGQTQTSYQGTSIYRERGGKWTATSLASPLQRVLDASADGETIVAAIPDTGCCGWSNRSNDQTLVVAHSKTVIVFDELAAYKNSDYDVSFFTSTAALSPSVDRVALNIESTAQMNKPIQLAEEGQANPQEMAAIRRGLAELPAVEVKSLGDLPKRVAYVPHAALVGWLSDTELLLVQEHQLVVYDLRKSVGRKTAVRVADAGHVFLR